MGRSERTHRGILIAANDNTERRKQRIMTEKTETCYFLIPQSNRCGILDEECTGTRSERICSFRKSTKEYFEARNKAVELNKKRGNCAKCKYKPFPCEPIKFGGDTE
jgi:hypothetical protein